MKRKFASISLTLVLILITITPMISAANSIRASDIVTISKELARAHYKYVYGGSSPSSGGFDCTGLVYYIYHTRLGYDMSLEQARSKSKLLAMGTKISNTSDLLPGDIIQYTASHVAIYIGSSKVLHAGTDRGVCTTTLENSKYGRCFSYGIRLPGVVQKDNSIAQPSNNVPSSIVNTDTQKTEPVEKTSKSDLTVTFDPNGGFVSQTSKTVAYGSEVGNMPVPTRDNYEFIGWGLSPKGSTIIVRTGIEIVVTENMTLYATWRQKTSEPTYTVTLDDGSVCSQITATNGSTYSNLTTPTRDGYTFDGWYTQQDGGYKVTTSTKVNLTGDQTLYAHWQRITSEPEVAKPERPEPETPIKNTESPKMPNRYWGPWSEWSEIPDYGSSTREVETRTVSKQEKISDGYTEYCYVGYATSDGRHECWCETYLKNKFGSANLRYSDWSTTRYSANGTGWTCGQCSGSHTGVDHYGSDGRAWWAEYTLPDGKNYYWEETRTTEDQYRTYEVTEYRYRDLIGD